MASTQPDYMKALDDLFGGMSSGDYLTKLLGGAPAVTNTSGSTTTPTERVLTEDEKKFGSYGTTKDIAGTDLSNVESVAAMAKRGGWADPYAFNTGMLENVEQGFTGGGESGRDPASFGTARFKQEFADARGITNTGRNLNNVQVLYKQNDDGTYSNEIDGYTVLAGALPGTKTHTALNYAYDKDGNFRGANFEAEEKFSQQIAPLVNMGLMAFGAGAFGGPAALGSNLNSALNLGLTAGGMGEAALAGAAVGGGTAALTGQNPIKGAALGAMGAGIGAFNPAGQLGITNPALGGAVNGAISGGAKAIVGGGKVEDALLNGAVNGGLGGLGRGLTRK